MNGIICTHPHIFRLTVKDAYHCLGCGAPVKVETYEQAETANPTVEDSHFYAWHMIEVDKKDIHVLHVSGCASQGKEIDKDCRFMRDLIENKPPLAVGEYDAYIDKGSNIPHYERSKKVTKTSQRALQL